MNKITKTFLFFILLLAFALPFVSAAKITQIGTSTLGYEISYPIINNIKINQTTQFHFHVYNVSNGIPITKNIGCYFHLFNQTSNHIVIDQKFVTEHTYDYSFLVNGQNFTSSGEYTYLVQCNGSTQGGYTSSNFIVSSIGKDVNEAKGLILLAIMLGSILALLGCAFLFAYLYANSDNLNKLLKLLYLGASMLCGIATVAVVEGLVRSNQSSINSTIAATLGGTYSMVLWVFRIVMSMWLIYLIYSSAMALLGKREDTYLDDERR